MCLILVQMQSVPGHCETNSTSEIESFQDEHKSSFLVAMTVYPGIPAES